MLWHRNRRATLRRTESAPPRSGRPQGDDGGAAWSESALGETGNLPPARKSDLYVGWDGVSCLVARAPVIK